MIRIKQFTFNPFAENTFVLWAEPSRDALIIDPGCLEDEEKEELQSFIQEHQLHPVQLINTHTHLDHIFGNRFVFDTWGLAPWLHHEDQVVLDRAQQMAYYYGITMEASPGPAGYLEEGDEVKLGDSTLRVIFTPGHCPGEICLYNAEQKILIAGDVLFEGSIGRTDLPGGDYDTLIQSIRDKIFPLGDDVIVYCGHGPDTTIGKERRTNPFLV